MRIDEPWIRAHLPPECAGQPIDFFSGEYLDGLTVMHEGERGGADVVIYQAKDEEDLRWWQLEQVCCFIQVKDPPPRKTWRYIRDHAEDGHWLYRERRQYDYNAIEDARLYGFEHFLRLLHFAFPPEWWEDRVQAHIRLMNGWYKRPHWDYDREKLCFIEISDSKEHDGDGIEEPRPGSVLGFLDEEEPDQEEKRETETPEKYSRQDMEYAAEFREEVHREALAILRETRPDIREVTDRHPVEDYFQEHWDYPGKWYTVVAIPSGYRDRKALVDAIVKDTLASLPPPEKGSLPAAPAGNRKRAREDDPFHALMEEYPDCVVEYFLLPCKGRYLGYDSHREALRRACERLFGPEEEGGGWRGDPGLAVGKRIPTEELFSSRYREGKLNYRRAFLYPPQENGYTGRDFVRVNAALFPRGTEELVAYEWTTDWSDYFDEGHEWWGALCLTVYDPRCSRFAVLLASATD